MKQALLGVILEPEDLSSTLIREKESISDQGTDYRFTLHDRSWGQFSRE